YGHFDASILPGIYILTATLEGYDTFTTEIEVIANETTLVEIILQYIEAPSAIWVELSEYYTADIFWNNITLSKDSLYRVFQSYTLLRKYDEEDWQIITEGLIDTTYSDSLLFEPDGDYKYGVKAIFETGQTEITESEPFNLFRFVDIAFNLSLSNGAAPVSIYLTMTGLDSIYSQSFSDTTDVSGVLHFADVFMTDYSIEINKDGYISIIDTITISVDTTEFWYVLQEQISSFTGNTIPHTYAISQNYPNPFHCGSNRVSGTKICYQLPKFSGVRIYIYNIRGEKIRSLIDEKKEPGYYEVTWNGRDDNNKTLSSGIYFYKLQVGNKVIDTKKCLILR
ncbi:MAG: T9SS type A sorting domain-containing protein, partial [Candidatus Cloacimonetes bacterium]|nr:T9SS type A sorting domain-containing protein [Candidatus Cloacimonadota bacterium]